MSGRKHRLSRCLWGVELALEGDPILTMGCLLCGVGTQGEQRAAKSLGSRQGAPFGHVRSQVFKANLVFLVLV